VGSPAKKLTHRQSQAVEAAMNPKNTSIAAVGRELGIGRKSAHRLLTKTDAADEVAKRRDRQTDKARGEVAQSQRLRKLVSKQLDSLNMADLDVIEVVAVAHKALQMQELEESIKAKYPDIESTEDGLTAVAAHTSRCIEVGRYLERRLHRAPQVGV